MKTTLAPIAAATLAGCTLPTIDVGTKEPIKIDPVEIKIDVNVYQHSGDAPAAEEQEKEQAAVIERLRNRMAEIQTLKSNLAVGENHLGLLVVRDIPAGYEANYVKDTVDAENADRRAMMLADARRRKVQMKIVQTEQWQSRINDAFEGEWIEVPSEDDPKKLVWAKKPPKSVASN